MKGIKVSGAVKSFGRRTVLKDVSVEFRPCTIYGLLGRNGAGKSTLISLICARIPANAGEITLDGHEIMESEPELNRIFAIGQPDLYQGSMRTGDIMKDTAEFYPGFDRERAVRLAERFGVNLKTRYGRLSTGYRTIFKDILALCVPCDYVFLDEPVMGVDAANRDLFYRELIEAYAARPHTFVIATHLIEEIQNLIEGVVIVDGGRVVLEDSVEAVSAKSHLVSGTVTEVSAYVEGLNVVGTERMGSSAGCYVYGELDGSRVLPDTVYLDSFDLNRLFMCLTAGGKRDDD